MKKVAQIVSFICRHRLSVAVAIFSWAIFAFFVIRSAKFSQNIYDLLPVTDDAVISHSKAAKFFGQSNSIFFDISGEDSELACDALVTLLSKNSEIAEISGKIDAVDFKNVLSEIIGYIPTVFSEKDAKVLEDKISIQSLTNRLENFKRRISSVSSFGSKDVLVADPIGILEIFYSKLKNSSGDFNFASMSSGRILSSDGKHFLLVAEGKFDSSDSARSEKLSASIDDIVEKIKREFPSVKIAYAGGCRIAADNALIARRDCSLCFFLTVALMAILCFVAFRNRIFSLLAVAPSLLGTSVAFVVLALLFDDIASISIAFASIAVGVSIDYAVHILYRLDSLGKIDIKKASETASQMSYPILVTSGTTIIAFLIIYFCGSKGFAQLGFFGAIGIFFSALASVFLMPAFSLRLGSSRKSTHRFFDKVSEKLSFVSKGKNFSTYAIFLISILTVPFILNLKVDGNISNLSAFTKSAKADDSLIRSVWGNAISRSYVLIESDSSDNVRLLCRNLEKLISDFGVKVYPISPLLPDSKTQKENVERWNKFWNRERKSELKDNFSIAAKSAGFNAKMFEKSFSKIFNPASSLSDFSDSQILSKIFKGKFTSSENGSFLAVSIELPKNTDKFAFKEFLTKVSPKANYIDTSFLGEHIADTAFNWLVKFALFAFLFASIYLYIISRRLRFVIAVLCPVVVGLLWGFGIMGALGVPINIVNAIFVIFAVSLAQDYVVFTIYSSMKKERTRNALSAILLSAFTTISAFAILALAQHPMLKSLGFAASISIFSILLACILFSRFSIKLSGGNQDV